ncbi:MAG TPA: hypothetical protein VNB23_07290 [Ramlibacter sp.]|nr:hypothetical protein [Ramlibacter sp.]
MPPPELLLTALRDAPRRYRMPALPPDAGAASDGGAEVALAHAIEAARTAADASTLQAAPLRHLFTRALAALIAEALVPGGGDPAFQALALRARDPDVDEHVRLAAQHVADRRAVRAALDPVGHPGRLRAVPDDDTRRALSALHALALDGAWTTLRGHGAALLERGVLPDETRDVLQGLLMHAGLQRLARAETLRTRAAVRHYQELCERRGPAAGSQAAAAQGRAAARTGGEAEEDTVRAFRRIAQLLKAHDASAAAYRAVASLRTPRGFPGAPDKAKDEWDAAIVCPAGDTAGAGIALLAEVKAAPAAAAPDFARLLRGLQRLAQADPGESYLFPSADGELRISGRSLRELAPAGQALPPHVVYCSSAAPESPVQMLSAASKAVLLSEPASLAFAQALTRGETPDPGALLPVWDALPRAPQLRSALHQYDTARAVREAMLHPHDLLQAVEAAATATGTRRRG